MSVHEHTLAMHTHHSTQCEHLLLHCKSTHYATRNAHTCTCTCTCMQVQCWLWVQGICMARYQGQLVHLAHFQVQSPVFGGFMGSAALHRRFLGFKGCCCVRSQMHMLWCGTEYTYIVHVHMHMYTTNTSLRLDYIDITSSEMRTPL